MTYFLFGFISSIALLRIFSANENEFGALVSGSGLLLPICLS
jgi:hypothetical protein